MSENPLVACMRHPEHWRRLAGTGLSWFLYDFVYYGTAFNQPTILEQVFGKAETVWKNCTQNIMVSAFGLPGVVAAIAMLRCLGSKRLQSWGFIAIGASSGMFALVQYIEDTDGANVAASFALTCLLIFFLNWGVNVSTYVLPTEAFPSSIRSSFFGVSAGLGKAGALLGTATFTPISNIGKDAGKNTGLSIIYLICMVVSLVGVLVTHFTVEPYNRKTFTGCEGSKWCCAKAETAEKRLGRFDAVRSEDSEDGHAYVPSPL